MGRLRRLCAGALRLVLDATTENDRVGETSTGARLTVSSTFDLYSWEARVFPVFLLVTPVLVAIAANLPEGMAFPLTGVSATLLIPLTYFASQAASDCGKRLEAKLWEGWTGPPTTRLLRHDNDEFNPVTRDRVHAKLRSLGLSIPTAGEEKADGSRAVVLDG